MKNNIEQFLFDTLEIIALNDILCFILNSDHKDEVDNLKIATLAKIIRDKLQDLANKIDQEIIKNAITSKKTVS